MHEHALMNDLMRRVRAAAEDEKASRVTGISVWLGALSHMSPEHFREHFDQAAAGTLAEHAAIEVTLSDDIHDPNATSVLLQGVEVETEG